VLERADYGNATRLIGAPFLLEPPIGLRHISGGTILLTIIIFDSRWTGARQAASILRDFLSFCTWGPRLGKAFYEQLERAG